MKCSGVSRQIFTNGTEAQQMNNIKFKELIQNTKLPDQSRADSSKYINFLLTYKCKAGNILDQMILDITEEIEDSEWDLSPSDNGRSPRKKKRPVDPDRRFKQAVRILILNLLQVSEVRGDDVSLAISKNANTYKLKDRYSPDDMTYAPFIEAYEGLERLGYLNIKHKGFYASSEGCGWCTRIIASDTLLSVYEDAKGNEHVKFITRKIMPKEKDELIILKGERSGAAGEIAKLKYKDTKFTNKARSNLLKINKVLSMHDIKLDCSSEDQKELLKVMRGKRFDDPEQVTYIDESATRLYRIFSEGSFQRGGRFYRGYWQQIPKDYRKYITIDNQRTAELDYSRFHISIAYAQLGLTPPEDSYKIHTKVSVEITKYAINAMLNSKDIVKKHKDFNARTCGMTWEKFIKLIEEVHQPIVTNGMWMKGYGLTLQYLDSILAEEVMLHFAKQDIPCLPIHDSFIVPEQYQEELREIMSTTYKLHFNQSILIK